MIHQDDLIFIEREMAQVPWLKIFTQRPVQEFSGCTTQEKQAIWKWLEIIEVVMLDYYNPTKINIASFGNYKPWVHWHIMARFEDDDYFPEPLWGKKQRQSDLNLPSFEGFVEQLQKH